MAIFLKNSHPGSLPWKGSCRGLQSIRMAGVVPLSGRRIIRTAGSASELLSNSFKRSERNLVGSKTAMEARAHLGRMRILLHTNSVRQVLFRLHGKAAILRLRRSFGSLTGKNIQHMLVRHGLGSQCASPCLAGPGAGRGILHMSGRSRLAGFRDSSWPQLLQWHQDLHDSRRKILSAFRLDFPEVRRGKGKSHGRIGVQDP